MPREQRLEEMATLFHDHTRIRENDFSRDRSLPRRLNFECPFFSLSAAIKTLRLLFC